MGQAATRQRGDGVRRLRWRLRGAWLWPAFVVATLLEALLLHWLPIAGDGPGLFAALLLAGSLNLIAVAVFGTLGGALLRRRRRDMPKIVADNYAGLAALAALALTFVVAGLLHRPARIAEREAFARQSQAVRMWVALHGDAFARAHVDSANSIRAAEDLYRTCIPREADEWLCLFVDTSLRPPRVTRDRSGESNEQLFPRGGFR